MSAYQHKWEFIQRTRQILENLEKSTNYEKTLLELREECGLTSASLVDRLNQLCGNSEKKDKKVLEK